METRCGAREMPRLRRCYAAASSNGRPSRKRPDFITRKSHYSRIGTVKSSDAQSEYLDCNHHSRGRDRRTNAGMSRRSYKQRPEGKSKFIQCLQEIFVKYFFQAIAAAMLLGTALSPAQAVVIGTA